MIDLVAIVPYFITLATIVAEKVCHAFHGHTVAEQNARILYMYFRTFFSLANFSQYRNYVHLFKSEHLNIWPIYNGLVEEIIFVIVVQMISYNLICLFMQIKFYVQLHFTRTFFKSFLRLFFNHFGFFVRLFFNHFVFFVRLFFNHFVYF